MWMVAKSKIENGTYFLGQENKVKRHLGTSDDVINDTGMPTRIVSSRRRHDGVRKFIFDGQR
jgi:hypothetical protein